VPSLGVFAGMLLSPFQQQLVIRHIGQLYDAHWDDFLLALSENDTKSLFQVTLETRSALQGSRYNMSSEITAMLWCSMQLEQAYGWILLCSNDSTEANELALWMCVFKPGTYPGKSSRPNRLYHRPTGDHHPPSPLTSTDNISFSSSHKA